MPFHSQSPRELTFANCLRQTALATFKQALRGLGVSDDVFEAPAVAKADSVSAAASAARGGDGSEGGSDGPGASGGGGGEATKMRKKKKKGKQRVGGDLDMQGLVWTHVGIVHYQLAARVFGQARILKSTLCSRRV